MYRARDGFKSVLTRFVVIEDRDYTEFASLFITRIRTNIVRERAKYIVQLPYAALVTLPARKHRKVSINKALPRVARVKQVCVLAIRDIQPTFNDYVAQAQV